MAKPDRVTPPAVPELLALQIEISVLKLQQLQTVGASLQAEQQRLVEQARVILGAPAGEIYNTETRSFQAPPSTSAGKGTP